MENAFDTCIAIQHILKTPDWCLDAMKQFEVFTERQPLHIKQ